MTEFDLLQRYAQKKDAQAFSELVTQYQRLIFATCRRKLRNPEDVNDAVQETFLRLARKASELHTNLGGWLHACAVNVSIDINRRRRSRFQHESAAASPFLAKDDPQRELAELREHLDAALQKLSPDERELIVQRFFVGSAQVDLAARAGVSPSTMSERIDRAIDALRMHFKALGCAAVGVGGTAALVEAMQSEHASAAVPQTLTANLMKIGLSGVGSAAGISMSLRLLIVLAACVLLGVGTWIAMGRLSGPLLRNSPMSQQATPAAAAPAAITVNPDQSGVAIAPNWQTTQASTESAVLAGRVLDEKGNPVPGATVQLDGARRQITRTDERGNYVFRSLRGGNGDYEVSVSADGFIPIEPYPSKEPVLQLSANSQARRDFVLQRGARVSVLVTDTANKPLGGVLIDACRLGEQSTGGRRTETTDISGSANYTLPIGQGVYAIFAMLKDYAPQRAMVNPTSADSGQQVKLVMQPGLKIKGLAICTDNKPATGWTISAEPDWWTSDYISPQSKIDQDGNFTLSSVGPGRYALYLWTEGGGQNLATVTFPPTTQPIRINVPMVSQASMVTATGRIRIVGSQKQSLWPNQVWVRVSSLERDHDSFTTFADVGPSGRGASRIPRNEARYTITVPAGAYRIEFESSYTEPASIPRVELPGELNVVTLRLAGKPHIAGTVTDAGTGAPIAHFAVRVRIIETLDNSRENGQDHEWTQVSNRQGHFDLECVGPGIYMVQASAPGYAWLQSPEIRVERNKSTPDIQMKVTSGGSLSGRLLDPAGKPVVGAAIIPFRSARTTFLDFEDRFITQADSTSSDSTGRFTVANLVEGDVALKVVHPDFAPMTVSDFKVAEGVSNDIGTLSMKIGGMVEGSVYDAMGKPVAGKALRFQNSDEFGLNDPEDPIAGWLASVTTDEAGHYKIEHLPEEVVWGHVSDWRGLGGVGLRVVHPMDGKTAHLDFGGTNPVQGRLLFHGQPYGDKDVQLTTCGKYFGAVVVTGTTDSDGNFVFFGPPPGRYYVYGPLREGFGPDWNVLHEVEVGDQPIDLGGIECSMGDVVVKFDGDDAAMAGQVERVSIQNNIPGRWANDLISEAKPRGDGWRATSVPAGHFRVAATLKDFPWVRFLAPLDRKQGATESSLPVHLPRIAASLKLIDTYSGSKTSPWLDELLLRNEDATVEVGVALGKEPTVDMKLPAGTYRIFNPLTLQPRTDFAPIVLKDGDSKQIQADFHMAASDMPERAEISIWSSDGMLVSSPGPRLIDMDGKAVERGEDAAIATTFEVCPGRYRVVIDRPGAEPFVKDIDIPQMTETDFWRRIVPIDVVLP